MKGWGSWYFVNQRFNEKKAVTSGNLLFSSTGILINCSWQIAPGSVMWRLRKKGSLEQDMDCPVPPASALEAFSPFWFCFVTLRLNIYSTICEREIGWSCHPVLWRNTLLFALWASRIPELQKFNWGSPTLRWVMPEVTGDLCASLAFLFIFRVCVLPSAFGNTKRKK